MTLYDADGEATGQVTDHHADALTRQVEQFKGSSNIEAYLRVVLNQADDVESAAWSLFTERGIDVAVGAQLDGLGEIVGLERVGTWGDAIYRRMIRTQILASRSEGRLRELVEILAQIFPDDTASIVIRERPPATVTVRAEFSPGDVLADATAYFLGRARPAGVRLGFTHRGEIGSSGVFRMAPYGTTGSGSVGGAGSEQGFGSGSLGEDGGKLSRRRNL